MKGKDTEITLKENTTCRPRRTEDPTQGYPRPNPPTDKVGVGRRACRANPQRNVRAAAEYISKQPSIHPSRDFPKNVFLHSQHHALFTSPTAHIMAPGPIDPEPGTQTQTEASPAPPTKLPPGMVLGPDGKPYVLHLPTPQDIPSILTTCIAVEAVPQAPPSKPGPL